jgi:hypothetical protein
MDPRSLTMALLGLQIWLASCNQENTEYASKFNKTAFLGISVGERVEQVISDLGLPLRIKKVCLDGSQPAEVLYPKDGFVFDTNPIYCYILSYSLQIDGTRDFERNSIRIERGIVVSKRSETVTD